MALQTKCPECATELAVAPGKAPGSAHTAMFYSCPACPWFAVERTPEHEADLKPKK